MSRVVVASKGIGRVHVAAAEGRAYRGACGVLLTGREVEHSTGRGAVRAWRVGPTCKRCADLMRRRVTGWEVN